MSLLKEMAKYHQQKRRYLFSGIHRFIMFNKDIFKRYDPNVKVVDQGDEHIEVHIELTEEQAESLGADLEKADDEWFAELEEFGYGGYILDEDE